MQQGKHTPLTRRRAIDRLFQEVGKAKDRRARKRGRRWIRRLVADQLAAIGNSTNGPKDRRLANAKRRMERWTKVAKSRAARAVFRASKPTFE